MNANRSIYQIKIMLRDSKPPIWRRLLVSSDTTLYQLHEIIQIAMGWTNSHLHQFIVGDEYYSIPDEDDWIEYEDERKYKLQKITDTEGFKFIYEYDFGDSWDHQILIEKILPAEPDMKYPICIKGKRACPPEDIGGVWGYEDFLEAINDASHKGHEHYREWWGGDFDSEEFNLEEINQLLLGYKPETGSDQELLWK